MCPWTPTLTPSLQQSQPPPVPTPLAPTTCPALQLEPSCGASQPSSGTVGGQPRSGWAERTVRGAGCFSGRGLPDYRRPVASAGAGVVALGLRALSSAVQLHREDGGSAAERAGPTSRSSSPLGVLALPRHSPARPARRMRLRSRRARQTTPPASPRPPPGARARARGAAACTDAMSALASTGA